MSDKFVKNAAELLGYSEKEFEDIMIQLPADQLIELIKSVNAKDRISAKMVLDRVNVLESVNHKAFYKGCPVRVGNKEGTISTPDGPYDLVGVTINGYEVMHPRDTVKHSERKVTLGETVLGMTDMGGIARLRTLAGMAPQGNFIPPLEAPEISVSLISDVTDDDANDIEEAGALSICTNAIQCLQQHLPELKIGEASVIRQSLYSLTAMLNESRRTRR